MVGITVILVISAFDTKLPTFIIFKDTHMHYLKSWLFYKQKKIFICCNLNCWSTVKV